jgi:hypothetical protein
MSPVDDMLSSSSSLVLHARPRFLDLATSMSPAPFRLQHDLAATDDEGAFLRPRPRGDM